MKKILIIDLILESITMLFLIVSIIFSILCNEYLIFSFIALFLIINSIVLYIVFSLYIKKCNLYVSDYNFINIFNQETVTLICKKESETYFLEYGEKVIEFRTDEKLLGNNMFLAYLTRNIRFPEVSNKRPMIFLFKRKVRLKNIKLKNLTVILNEKKYVLVKNGVSKYNFTLINKAWYWRYFLSRRAIAQAMVKDVNFIDERKFLSGDIV